VDSFNSILAKRLETLRESSLFRQLRKVESPQQPQIQFAGRTLLNFSSNDYLGLANHPAVKQAAVDGIQQYGTGAGASRLISGSLLPHHQLESRIARFKQTEAALAFSSGYATALGTIPALVGRDDIIVIDKLVHASIVDGARLAGSQLRVFAHNNVEDLKRILTWCAKERLKDPEKKVLIITESVFSMDGDAAPLREIVELKEQFGTWLMVDEAHASGLFGDNRRGLAEDLRVSNRIEVQMGTLGKAFGVAGGFIAGSQVLADYLVNRARSFIFSTAPVPAQSAAAMKSLEIVESQEGLERLNALRGSIQQFTKTMQIASPFPHSPIFPLIIGQEDAAMELANELFENGFFVPAIRYPTVSRGKARLRFTFSSSHTASDISALTDCLCKIMNKRGIRLSF
jgi:8-amino-7-oxononanoate synthase